MLDEHKGAWNPTPEQFARYLDREVEMAVVKLQRRETGQNLHSPETMERARERVE